MKWLIGNTEHNFPKLNYDQAIEIVKKSMPDDKKGTLFVFVDNNCTTCAKLVAGSLTELHETYKEYFDIVTVDQETAPFPPNTIPVLYAYLPNGTEVVKLLRNGNPPKEVIEQELIKFKQIVEEKKTVKEVWPS